MPYDSENLAERPLAGLFQIFLISAVQAIELAAANIGGKLDGTPAATLAFAISEFVQGGGGACALCYAAFDFDDGPGVEAWLLALPLDPRSAVESATTAICGACAERHGDALWPAIEAAGVAWRLPGGRA
jgi:hypothetical protein